METQRGMNNGEGLGETNWGIHLKGRITMGRGRVGFDMQEGNLFLRFVSKQKEGAQQSRWVAGEGLGLPVIVLATDFVEECKSIRDGHGGLRWRWGELGDTFFLEIWETGSGKLTRNMNRLGVFRKQLFAISLISRVCANSQPYGVTWERGVELENGLSRAANYQEQWDSKLEWMHSFYFF